ncbi:MAG: single-stranded DNA-binding protein, partial [Roseiflexus sp.]
DGVQHDDTEWFRIVAWDKLAEICNEYLKKGTRVYIEGRLQTRSWDDRNTGEKRYITEVVAQDMIILTPKGDRVPAEEIDVRELGGVPRRSQAPSPDVSAPVANGPARVGATRAPVRNTPQPVEEDDIPF